MGKRRAPPAAPAGEPAAQGVAANGARWEIYDTCCKDFGPKEKEEADRRLAGFFLRAQRKNLQNK